MSTHLQPKHFLIGFKPDSGGFHALLIRRFSIVIQKQYTCLSGNLVTSLGMPLIAPSGLKKRRNARKFWK